jgi:CRISPR-associated protein Csh2
LDDLEIESAEDLTEKCVDIRLFGATAAVKKRTITFTGPVQFRIGRSLHRVQLKFIRGTTVYPSGSGKDQGTFTEMYVLPYSLIGFYGVVNENAAVHTGLRESDVELLMEGMWNGTKNLISRSKVGQMPRLLMKVNYKEKNYHIGDLEKLLTLKTDKREEEIRDLEDYVLEAKDLLETLARNREKIDSIDFMVDQRLNIVKNGSQINLQNELADLGFHINSPNF